MYTGNVVLYRRVAENEEKDYYCKQEEGQSEIITPAAACIRGVFDKVCLHQVFSQRPEHYP